MDRREALLKLPELSAGCLDAQTEEAVRRWVAECPECKAEWTSLEKMVGTLHAMPDAGLSTEQSQKMWARCNEALFEKIEAQRLEARKPSPFFWFQSQPRWGWALLGGAAAALGASLLAPDAAPTPEGTLRPPALASAVPAGASGAGGAGELQQFGRPPAYAATLVDNHAQMGASPFTDRVGSSLVSYSASNEVASR
jgi:hypothetical protein